MAADSSLLTLCGAASFGAIIGWHVFYINRYRAAPVEFSDLTTLIGIIGGGAILALFPGGSAMFGAYGIGLAIGFFAYFCVLLVLVARSPNFDADYFLDGRRKDVAPGYSIPGRSRRTSSAMGVSEGGDASAQAERMQDS